MEKIDRLLKKECYIIDFLPVTVPKESSGQFFEVENYLLNNYGQYDFKKRYINILLKLMCYDQISIHWKEWKDNPTPEYVVETIDTVLQNHSDWIDILIPEKDVLIQLEGDCLNMSVYNPDENMCKLLEQISLSEGMFWRRRYCHINGGK